MKNTKQLVAIGLLLALSAIGAQLKIFGSIAFDSAPAFLAAILIGPVAGGIVGLLGHMITAMTSGFPYGLPIHIVVAVMMYVSCWGFGVVFKRFGAVAGGVAAVLLNGPVSLTVSAYVMMQLYGAPMNAVLMSDTGLTAALVLPFIAVLTLAALLNVLISLAVYKPVKKALSI